MDIQVIKKAVKLTAACFTVAILGACGGGGSGDSVTTSTDTTTIAAVPTTTKLEAPVVDNQDTQSVVNTPTTVNLSGSVTKGLLKNAKVSLYNIANGQVVSEPVFETSTNDQGGFTVSATDLTDVLYLVVGGKDNETTLMQCDLSDCGPTKTGAIDDNADGIIQFGEWQAVDSQFRITSYTSDWTEDNVQGVNIYTHLIATQFTQPPLGSQLKAANTDLQQTLQLTQSPSEIKAVDVLAEGVNLDDLQDSLLSAAILEVSSEAGSLGEKLAELANQSALSDGNNGSFISLSKASAQATVLAEFLPSEAAQQVVMSFVKINKDSAVAENKLSLKEQPLHPPFM